MSRARNRADGDFGDLDITNIGAVSLDSIKGDADGNTSLAFSGSDVITITTGGTTAMTIDASQNTTLAGSLTAVTSITVGSAALTEAELELLDGITAGTAAASKVLVLDSNKDIGTIRNLTIDGTFSDGNYTFDTSGNVSGLGTVASGNITSSGTISAGTAFVPDASDGAALGTTSLEFSDLFLADGAVINFGADQDINITHVADTGLTTNGSFTASGTMQGTTITATTAFVPDASDGAALGTSSLEFSDLFLADGGEVKFGADQDVLLRHDHNSGLIIDRTNTSDNSPTSLTLSTAETDIQADDVIGKINFQAPDEATGTDAVLVSAAIQARSEGDFSSSANATSIDFMTGASEAAATKMSLTSGGDLQLSIDSRSILFGNDNEIALTHVADV